MPNLHIEHPITDFATWKQAFERLDHVRATAGVVNAEIQQPVNDPLFVVIDLEFATIGEAERFLDFLEKKVWASSNSAPALAGRPRTAILVAASLPAAH